MREGLETYLTFIAFIAFGTINHRCLIRERLESHLSVNHCQGLKIQPNYKHQHGLGYQLATTISSSFINVFDILNEVISLLNKTLGIGYTL